MITIAPQYTQREYRWSAWKAVQTRKGFAHQFDEEESKIVVWGYDGPEVHLSIIYKTEVPESVVTAGYTQEQNDLDKTDFEENWKPTGNGAIIAKMGGEVLSLGIKNNHRMEPWGATIGHLIPSQYCCPITLSNKSENGLTFSYNSNVLIEPVVGAYVFQSNNTKRSWITAVDTENHTLTFDLVGLENAEGFYRKGYYIDCKIRDWQPLMYLWGLYLQVVNSNEGDFVEFNVIDLDHLFESDEYCQGLFGVNAADAAPYIAALGYEKLGEFDDWCVYYDESWVINMNNREVKTPDGAPGTMLANHYLRVVYFPAATDNNPVKTWVDYLPTSKDDGR